ncbi:MAG: hypothetical protein VSS75_027165 [Candidatus Parabeggiatoa sp.]|nr:hypothetical protein [Candidatus Parabeggiatoa sp.]
MSNMRETELSLQETVSGNVDITPLLGTWLNSNAATKWIKKFTLAKTDDVFTLDTFAVEAPFDWGKVEISTYMDNIGEIAFHAVYDLGFMESVFAANSNKGLIVIAAFHQFKDNTGRSNFLCREFFYREQ